MGCFENYFANAVDEIVASITALFPVFEDAESIIYVPVDSQIVIWDELCIFINSCALFIT